MKTTSKKAISTVLCTAAAALWGYAFVAQKMLSYELEPFTVGTMRAVIATVTIAIAILVFDAINGKGRRLFSIKNKKLKIGINKTELLGGFLCGIILSAASTVQQFGITGTDSGKAAFITTLYVVIVPIYSLFFKKKSPPLVWFSIAVAVVGFYLISVKDSFKIEASDMLVFVCSLIFAWHIVVIGILSPKCDGFRISLVQFATMAVITAPISIIAERPSLSAIASSALPLLYLGIFSSGIAYTFQILGQKYANPAVASVLLSLESVFGVIGGATILGEKMTVREYIGCAIVFVAVVISQLSSDTDNSKTPDPQTPVPSGQESETLSPSSAGGTAEANESAEANKCAPDTSEK